MQSPRLNQYTNFYQVAIIGAWIIFLLRLMLLRDPLSTVWLHELWLQEAAEVQVVLNWPTASTDVAAVRVVTERGDSLRRESWTVERVEGKQALAIQATGPGRLAVKVVGLDVAGCSLFGGSVEAVIAPKPTSPRALQIELKKLNVPLCD